MNDTQQSYQDDEIDLRELFTTLWEGKLLILALAGTITAGGLAYALLAPQEWSAKAIVVEATPSEVGQLRLRLENIVTTTKINNNNNNTEFLTAFSEEKLFAGFIQTFDSFDNKATFLKEKGYLPPIENVDDKNAIRRAVTGATRSIAASQKKTDKFYTLSFSADNAADAAKRINEYLSFVKTQEEQRINKQLADKIAAQTNALTLQYQLQKADTLKRLQEDITRTELALRVSKAAGIETPVENLNNQTLISIDLGAKALDEKLKVLKEIKEPEILSSALADTRLQLDSLKALPTEKVSFTPYHFLQSPEEPISRDKPKRPLVVALSAIAGLMLGVMTVLLRSWWRKTSV